jgi:LCP family protein required for cell wall assembly
MTTHRRTQTAQSMSIGGTYPQSVVNTRPERKTLPYRKLFKIIFILIIVMLLMTGGLLGWNFYKNTAKITGNSNPLQLLSLFKNVPLQETDGRVNILLAGYSVDDPNHQGAQLTDSIMIVSISPENKSAILISIPRDMWVDIPGYGYQKINAAYEDGQTENFNQSGYTAGGMGLLEEVISTDFGVQSNYYGLLDYAAFKDAVDAVNGVTVTIQSSDPRGLYDPNTELNLPNGTVTLNGQEALDLARARGDGIGSYGFPEGDFNRTQHQQQLLLALKNKIANTSVISDPIKIAELSNAIGNNLKTNMSLAVLATLYRETKSISNENVKSVTLNNINGTDLLQSYYTPDGEDALIPAAGYADYTEIQSALAPLLDQK